MDVDRKFIINTARATGFQPDILEKAYRLVLLLKEINIHPALQKDLLLKGGTAINFVYLSLPRLSVDLDFDFVGSVSKEKKDARREDIKRYLMAIFSFTQYKVEEKSEYGLHQFFLRYKNSAGNTDIIKLEINYLMRIPVLPGVKKKIQLPLFRETDIFVMTLSLEEIYGGKIKALISRGAARDLFDTYSLFHHNIGFNKSLLKKIVIFFGCLDRSDFREFSSESINSITERDIKTNLLPLLRKGTAPSANRMIKEVKPILKEILTFTLSEMEYIDKFFHGEYDPALLFAQEDGVNLVALREHPMIMWKQKHIQP